MRRAVALAFGGAMACAALALAPAARAVTLKGQRQPTGVTPSFGAAVQPARGSSSSYFTITAVAGKPTLAGQLNLYNRGAQAVRVTIDAVDAITTNTLGSAYQVRGLPLHGATLWTRVGARQLLLPARGTRSVGVSVVVPPGTAGGDYLSGVAIQAIGPAVNTRVASNVGISSVSRYAVGLEVLLPGPRRPRLDLTGASIVREPSATTFLLAASNSGNVILKDVTGSILITRGARTVANVPILPGTFVTNTSIAYPVRAPRESPGEGAAYRVRAVLRYRGGLAKLDRTVIFGARQARLQEQFSGRKNASSRAGTPWAAILIPGLLLVAALAVLIALRRSRRRPIAEATGPLELALAGATPDRPVSVIVVEPADAPELTSLLRRRMRPTDTLVRTSRGALAILAPETGARTAAGLAEDLRGAFRREQAFADSAPSVGVATSAVPETPAQLLARVHVEPGHSE